MVYINIWLTASVLLSWSPVLGIREYRKEDILKLREEVREMFTFAYDSYLRHAYPADELRPLSCDGVDTWGSYSLTLVDALDTLAIMGNYTEFNRVVQLVLKRNSFDADINVSVFETNIRIVGGLLSAHLLSYKTGMELEPGWPCNGPLLRLAEEVARRLAVAFDTRTGMPYGTVNLRSGVPPGETSVTCAAGVGTFIVEFGTLSRLTGDPLYEELAYNALLALYEHRSPLGLLGNHIDVQSGRWTAQDAGIGGGVDSYYEYLVKGAILLERPELMWMFTEARAAVERHLRKDDWYVWATMLKGQVSQPVFQSLEAYWPGLLSLVGDTDTAMRILHNYHSVWRQYGFTPEVWRLGASEAAAAQDSYPLRPELIESIMYLFRETRDPSVWRLGAGEAAAARESYPLRPELIESIMYLYRETRDPVLLQMGEDILRSIQHSARTHCGYATIKDVRDHRREDRMESFFLAETTKYLYLLFDPDNFVHNPGARGDVVRTAAGECIVGVGGYIFNTEAHPVDPALLHCCHHGRNGLNLTEVHRMYQVLEDEDDIKLTSPTPEESSQERIATSEPTQEDNNIVSGHAELVPTEQSTTAEKREDSGDSDGPKEEIKTETRAGYIKIDGSEWKKTESDVTGVTDDAGERDSTVADNSSAVVQAVEVGEIRVADAGSTTAAPATGARGASRAGQMLSALPAALRELLGGARAPACEPQHLLERVRRERSRHPPHPHAASYELLLTPAAGFMQRVSLAGEFLEPLPLDARV